MAYLRAIRAPAFLLLALTTAILVPLSAVNAAQPSPEIVVAPENAPRKIGSVIASDAAGNFVVLWSNVGGEGIYGQRYASSGAPRGGVFEVSAEPAVRNATVAMDAEGRFFVVWTTIGSSPRGMTLRIRGRRFDSAAVPEAAAFQIASAPQTNGAQGATVAMNSLGEAVVAWNERSTLFLPPLNSNNIITTSVKMQRFNASGQRKGLVQTVSSSSAYSLLQTGSREAEVGVNVAINNSGRVVVTWSHQNPEDGFVVYARRYGPQGAAQGPEFQASSNARVAVGVDAAGNPLYSGSDKFAGGAAIDDAGLFTLVWQQGRSYGSPSQSVSGVFKRRYSADGVPLEDESLVIALDDVNSFASRVALDGAGNAVVVWATFLMDGDFYPAEGTINAQRFDTNGAATGAPIRLNTLPERVINSPALAPQAGGGFIAGWIAGRAPYIQQFTSATAGDAVVTRCCTP